MRLSALLLLPLGSASAAADRRAARRERRALFEVEPGARHLTIEETLKMISTETGEEYELSDNPIVNRIVTLVWDNANAFEWAAASQAEFDAELDDPPRTRKYPYLLCHVGTDENGKSLSGFRRKIALGESIGLTVDEMEKKKGHFNVLYNEEDFLCVYGQLLASVAANITGDDFVVQPILASLKYMAGSVDAMRTEVEFLNNSTEGNNGTDSLSLDVTLCPGVSLAKVGNETIALGWEELSDDVAGDILESLVPTTLHSILATEIADSYYLISEEYEEDASELGEEPTERSKLWKETITKYKDAEECKRVYQEKLMWKMQRGREGTDDPSLLNVEFPTSGNTELDAGCMLTLSLAVAAHPDVCSLEKRERPDVRNTVIQWLTQSEVPERRPFFDSGLDGTGQVVAVSDTGVDRDNCYFAQEEDADSLLNLANRKIVQYRPFVDDGDYEYGHGTHVAGTIAGKRVDKAGIADGTAPGARLAVADIGDSSGALSLPFDFQLLETGEPDRRGGAKIHSASWGSDLNYYTTQARTFDQTMYENDEFLVLVAAGNSGKGDKPNSVGAPATGKNVIAVGAHHNTDTSRPARGLGPSYIADFSSRGPTADGRTKPDILAPGKAVLSAGALPDQKGECDPPENPGANGKADGVLSIQGTSMATPVVSGTAAILRQYFAEGYYPYGVKNATTVYPNPSGALIKAVLMNGAQYLKGVDNGGDGVTNIQPYDNNQNFGRLALQHSVYLKGKTNVQLSVWDRRVVQDQRSDSYTIKIDKTDGCKYDKLSVTLVWFEEGSSIGCNRCLINDLDLTVSLGGKLYYPNGRSSPDRTNSAERVVVTGVKDGDVATITVEGFNLAKRAQEYSLVATGCFGGVANTMLGDQCSVFDCDESKSTRMSIIMMAIFIPLGALCLCGCGLFFYRRKQQE